MESLPGPQPVGFAVLRRRLLTLVNTRIANGEFTERGLARLIGVSQPQVHNILKGARNLSTETGDVLLTTLKISISELLTLEERSTQPSPAGVSSEVLPRRKPAATELRRTGLFLERLG